MPEERTPYCSEGDVLDLIKKSEFDGLLEKEDPDDDDEPTPEDRYERIGLKVDKKIDTYLISSDKQVPLPEPIPDVIKTAAAIMRIYYLHFRGQPDEVPERWREEYKDQIKYLEAIARGAVNLDVNMPAKENSIPKTRYGVAEKRMTRQSI